MPKEVSNELRKKESENLRKLYYSLKKEHGLRIEDIAEDLGISQGGASHYLNGTTPLNIRVALVFSNRLKVPISAFSPRLQETQNHLVDSLSPEAAEASRRAAKVPVIAWDNIKEFTENPVEFAGLTTFYPSAWECSPTAFWATVVGSSMSPDYHEGELMLVDPVVAAINGCDCIVEIAPSRYLFRRLEVATDGRYLIALNPDEPVRKIQFPENGSIVGVVIGSLRDRRPK